MIDCVDPEFTLEPGQSATITILTQKPLGDQAEAAATIENCAVLRWPLGDTSAPELSRDPSRLRWRTTGTIPARLTEV